MSKELSVSLDLNEEIRLFIRKRLSDFASENPKSKFNVLCWIDDLSVDAVVEINDYLAKNNCPSRLKTGGKIIGKGRSTFDRLTKKEII